MPKQYLRVASASEPGLSAYAKTWVTRHKFMTIDAGCRKVKRASY